MKALKDCLSELESWAGMKFRVTNFSKDKEDIYLIQSKSE